MASKNVAGISPAACQNVMLKVLSVFVKIFAINIEEDHIRDAHNINKGPKPNWTSGLKTIKAPENPINMAIQRLIPTISFKKTMAKIVAKIGTVNIKAVAFANSVILRP